MCHICDRRRRAKRDAKWAAIGLLIVLATLLSAVIGASVARAGEFLWSPAYNTLDEAAVAALDVVRDQEVEYLGLLYEINGKYLFTVPVTNDDRDNVVATIEYPQVARLAGLYHNHPNGEARFSELDVEVARGLDVPSFIIAGGEMRVWNPIDYDPRRYAAAYEPAGDVLR